METLDILIHDGRFWTAVVFLVQTVIFFFVPNFPAQIWEALSALLTVIFAALTIKSTRTEKAQRAMRRAGTPQG